MHIPFLKCVCENLELFFPSLPKIFTSIAACIKNSLPSIISLIVPKKERSEEGKKKKKGKNFGKGSSPVIWGLLVYKPSTFDLVFLLKSEWRTSSLWSSPHHVLRNAGSPALRLFKAWMNYCSRFYWLRMGAGLFPLTINQERSISSNFFSAIKAVYQFSVFIKAPSMETRRHPERTFHLTR